MSNERMLNRAGSGEKPMDRRARYARGGTLGQKLVYFPSQNGHVCFLSGFGGLFGPPRT